MSARYPSEVELEHIRKWGGQDFHALMGFVRSIWWMPDWGWQREGDEYSISTGGWSGNEDVIEALKESESMFWMFCWQTSRRGGHHTFEVPSVPLAPADEMRREIGAAPHREEPER